LVLATRNLGSITGKGTRLRADGKRPVTRPPGGR
jgi:hypothetical protein